MSNQTSRVLLLRLTCMFAVVIAFLFSPQTSVSQAGLAECNYRCILIFDKCWKTIGGNGNGQVEICFDVKSGCYWVCDRVY